MPITDKRTRPCQKERADLLIVNANELVTLDGGSKQLRIGKRMQHLGIIHNGALAVRKDRIIAVGKTSEIRRRFKAEVLMSADGKTVMPGFVDPHTHLVFAGSREDEFQMRVEGDSYMKILNAGGGILDTVKKTRRASADTLVEFGFRTLDLMLEHGTTTVEAKSGYGLTVESELKILKVAKRLDKLHPVDVVPTFMGAHVFPGEYKSDPQRYVDYIVEKMIPRVSREALAEFCDVFCEKGVFGLAQSRRILAAGLTHGLKPKVHADEMSMSGGAELAADVEAISAEHLLFSSEKGLTALADKGVIAVLLPAAAFSLMAGRYADARRMIDLGVPVALGSDFNPSCWVENQQLVISFACHLMKLTPAEAITASTINAAHAIERGNEIGSLEVAKKADFLILDAPNHRFLGYRFGVNIVDKVFKNGRLVFDREKQPMNPFIS
ncbi:imidazolonepropionase [Candidatus Bathyarchaeota archaeon]|nr:imidazolonepropionase [Candidatus Bathyarchaeota archaeon]